MLFITIQGLGCEGHAPEFLRGVSLKSCLVPFGVPLRDVHVRLGSELIVRVEFMAVAEQAKANNEENEWLS